MTLVNLMWLSMVMLAWWDSATGERILSALQQHFTTCIINFHIIYHQLRNLLLDSMIPFLDLTFTSSIYMSYLQKPQTTIITSILVRQIIWEWEAQVRESWDWAWWWFWLLFPEATETLCWCVVTSPPSPKPWRRSWGSHQVWGAHVHWGGDCEGERHPRSEDQEESDGDEHPRQDSSPLPNFANSQAIAHNIITMTSSSFTSLSLSSSPCSAFLPLVETSLICQICL